MERRPGDITMIILTVVADSLARQGAKMGDTIALCTRILLATQDLHNKRTDQGGSGRTRGARGDRWKKNMAELFELLPPGSDRHFIAGPGR